MGEYRVVLGDIDSPDYEFDSDAIVANSISYGTAIDLVGTELSADVFSVVVDYEVGGAWLFSPSDYDGVLTEDGYWFGTADTLSDITQIPYGTAITLLDDNTLICKFYTKNIARIGETKYKINGTSAIGFFMDQKHMGGIYANETIADFLTELIGNSFDYSVDPAVASETISGWLPIDTKRNNLHRVMQSMGVTLTKDANGDIQFTFLYDNGGTTVPQDRIYIDGTVEYNTKASASEVTEHSYIALTVDEDQLFDNSTAATVNNLLIEFSEPYHDLRATTGLTIVDSGVNYAILSGNGALYGQKYTHNTRTIQQALIGYTGKESIVKCDNNTMVNALNAENVAKRLLSYYSSRKTVSASIVNEGEKCGDLVNMTDAFHDAESGYIVSMDTVASTFLKSVIKLITGYTPVGQGNAYHNRVVISASGTWTAPSGITDIRLLVFGGAQGGAGGYDGEDSLTAADMASWQQTGIMWWRYKYEDGEWQQPAAQGGNAGTPGSGGKMLVGDYTITDGETLTFNIGVGGTGGTRNGGAGANGTATTVSSTSINISSDDGTTVQGYVDPVTQDVYGTQGASGVPGGNGGQTDTNSLAAFDGYPGLSGGDVGEQSGGAGGAQYNYSYELFIYHASGGGGGGAAYGADGGAGGDAGGMTSLGYGAKGGDGGTGADAVAPSKPSYGIGGGAGNGGGGGGNPGGAIVNYSSGTYYAEAGAQGAGGQGSAGGDGGDGVAIIYY